jgi:hypothetical protein
MTPVRHYFEALNQVDHRTPVPATGLYLYRLLSRYNRLQLASVARYLWDNVGLVFYATDLVANYSTPMMPKAATLNRKWNEAANAYFEDWVSRADFTGRFDFWDLQRLMSFYLDTDGEVFALWTDEAGFPQVQFLESWRFGKQPRPPPLCNNDFRIAVKKLHPDPFFPRPKIRRQLGQTPKIPATPIR